MTNLQRSLGNYDIFFLGTYPSTGFSWDSDFIGSALATISISIFSISFYFMMESPLKITFYWVLAHLIVRTCVCLNRGFQ